MPLILGWLGGFLLQAVLRSQIQGTPLVAAILPITGMAFLLFTFYMVTDPATTPVSPRDQFVFGAVGCRGVWSADAGARGVRTVLFAAGGLLDPGLEARAPGRAPRSGSCARRVAGAGSSGERVLGCTGSCRMMSQSIALVGLSCVYPDARSPAELWENVLAGRRAFRELPPERLRVEDYWSADRGAADRTYAVQAALIEGYEFDRVGFRVSGESFRAADLAHWLALDVAARALKRCRSGRRSWTCLARRPASFWETRSPGNSPARMCCGCDGPTRAGWSRRRCATKAGRPSVCRDFLGRLETQFKAPFPPVGEETLAGGLSNTIAGRICNHFDFKGGGYTVDGACASSLLAVAHACSALAAGDLDVALAGGVDLSIDPFELVGFAKAGALAADWMRVYDARSDGFWPGEGCGVVVLMRLADAIDQGRRVVAVIRGWGISSDGQGGITRPEVEGQLLAIRRAYRRAGLGIETVAYFEGHGTGTSVGDATELRALGRALREAGAETPAGRHRLDQGEYRPHQGRCRRRRADQGRPGPRGPDPAPDHRLRPAPPRIDR